MTAEALIAYCSGFGLGFGLIVSIGAQNAFVLVQSIRKEHHYFIASICALIDAVLISAGVLGIGALVTSHPMLRIAAGAGGALFLFYFGCTTFKASRQSQAIDLTHNPLQPKSRKKILLMVLAVSLLNPHVYLDTVIMVGTLSGHYPGTERYLFGMGALTASFIWFFSLAKCGSVLAPFFSKESSWKILYLLVTATVWLVGCGLLFDVISTLLSLYAS